MDALNIYLKSRVERFRVLFLYIHHRSIGIKRYKMFKNRCEWVKKQYRYRETKKSSVFKGAPCQSKT